MLTVDCCLLQGGKFFTGHWFYSLWNTALVVQRAESHGVRTKEDPVQLSPKHIFRASDHDNDEWNQLDDGPFGNTQSLQAIDRCGQHARPHACHCLSSGLLPLCPSTSCAAFPCQLSPVLMNSTLWHTYPCVPHPPCSSLLPLPLFPPRPFSFSEVPTLN